MDNGTLIQVLKMAAVIVLLGVAAALATPKGRVPLALRGLWRTLGVYRQLSKEVAQGVPSWKRGLALGLVLVAIVLCVL